eukprot:4428123-Amphidinium_carterae.2
MAEIAAECCNGQQNNVCNNRAMQFEMLRQSSQAQWFFEPIRLLVLQSCTCTDGSSIGKNIDEWQLNGYAMGYICSNLVTGNDSDTDDVVVMPLLWGTQCQVGALRRSGYTRTMTTQ